jgi:hypothetical protein
MRVILGVQKRPYLPEAEKKSRRNAASAAMVQVGGWQKVKYFTKEKVKTDHVGIPSTTVKLRSRVRQIQADVISFQILVK